MKISAAEPLMPSVMRRSDGWQIVHDSAAFSLVIDASTDDPISQDYLADARWSAHAKRWLKRLLSLGCWPYPSRVPHIDLLRQLLRPGDRVLDLGAHIGTVSLAAAALGCEVAAVEPDPRNAALLRASADYNGFDQLQVIEMAVSDHAGMIEFSPRGPFGHIATAATNLPSIRVRTITVDDLLTELGWQHVDFVKMDIEGSELAALRGMKGLLSRPDAPPILYECNSYTLGFYASTPTELKIALEGYGYRRYEVKGRSRVLVRPNDIPKDVVTDYLAVKSLGQ
jgi:FkbM family methyltransferase